MADPIPIVARALNAVKTYGQARIAVGEALSEIGRSYSYAKANDTSTGYAADTRTLDRVRLPLEAWFAEIKDKPGSALYPEFSKRRDTITKAYVETFGILGAVNARNTVSFLDEVGTGIKSLPRDIGQVAGQLATGVGETAGSLVGGLFSGLGPIVVIVLAVVIYLAWKSRR